MLDNEPRLLVLSCIISPQFGKEMPDLAMAECGVQHQRQSDVVREQVRLPK